MRARTERLVRPYPIRQPDDEYPGRHPYAKGYLSQPLFAQLLAQGLELITPRHKNMKQPPLPLEDQLLLRKRSVIEIINDQLKSIPQIEHTKHRSVANLLVNFVCG